VSVEVRTLSRPEVAQRLGDIAPLRIIVFWDWPYLYDGDPDYEGRYLRPYAESPRAVVVGAFDGRALVEAATGRPLADHEEGMADALRALRLSSGQVFYLAESVPPPGTP
jgi:hypothetical protein